MQDTVTRCTGLVTQYNPVSVTPGALIQADNAVVRRENVIENRRGHAVYGSLPGAPKALMSYLQRVIAHNGTAISYDNGAGTFQGYSGSYTAPTGYKMRGIEANQNLYVTTSLGVKVITDVSGTAARLAGAPRSLDPSYALNSGGTGFLSNGYQCAYRCVIQRTDANSNVLYGYPSTRLVVYNTAGTSKNVDLTLYLPSEVTTSDVIQFYRTAQVSGTTDDASGDEMQLVYQVNPTATDITNGYLVFTDSIVDALRGASLYTSPSQEGMAQANDRPPLASDLGVFKTFLFYANTSTKQRLFFSLVGTAGLSGKTLTLAGVTYNFGATEIVSGAGSPQVKVSATGVAAVDIDETARSMVRVINRYASNTSVYAYYLSGPDDLPGSILIEERVVGGAAFSIQAQDATISAMLFPPPPVSPATNSKSTSSNSVQKNGLYFSKSSQFEAVPALNYVTAGPANKEIVRIAPLRDSLIIISEAGVYRLTGESPQSFTIVPLDLTVRCAAPESVVVLANQVFMLSNQGVVAVNDTGVQVVSREIEPNLLPLLTYSNMKANTVGAAYESERQYMLSTVSNTGDSAATQTFVYNVFTRTWTRFTFGFTCALVEPTVDKLFIAKPALNYVYRERKDFADTDFADPDYAITITAVSGSSVTFSIVGGTPTSGWAIEQGSTAIPVVSFSETGAGLFVATLLYPAPASWGAGAAKLYPDVGFEIKYDAWHGGQAGVMKQVSQVELLADNIPGNNNTTALSATFKTDLDQNQENVAITSAAYRWGTMPWGIAPWGGRNDTFAYRTYPPRNKQYCRIMNAGIKHVRARERVAIVGISYTYNQVSERVNR